MPTRLLVSTLAAASLLVAVPVSAPAAEPPAPTALTVRTVSADRLGHGVLTTADGHRAAVVLGASNRYAMTAWWPRVAPALLARVATAPSAQDKTDAVRRLGMQAMSLAVSLRTGAYDPARAGASRSRASDAVVQIVSVLAANHRANRADGWGIWGQSALWSSFCARAAWLIWNDLSPQTQQRVTAMLTFEADLATETQPQYLRNRAGSVVRPGNSAAEEDSWEALPLQLATAMLPGDPRWVAWRHAQIALMLSAWARPQDVNTASVVNGAAVASWVSGSNVEPDGTVVNHDRIAPDYSTNLYQNLDEVLVDALAGIPTPEAARWGLAHVYAALTDVTFSGRGYAAPGGTVYQRGRFYYPQGCDWGTGQALPYALVDAQAAAFGFGDRRSGALETQHLHQQARLQARFHNGRTFASDKEYRYVGREEHTAQLAAQLYLTKLVRDRDLASFTNESFFAPGARDAAGLVRRPPVAFSELGVVRG